MSVLGASSQTSALPHTSALAPDCPPTGNFWGSGPTEIPFVESPTASEALSLSLLLAIQPEWTPENRDLAQVEQSQRVAVGRKQSLDPPQFVSPHVLTTSSGHYTPTSESPEVGSMRHASHTPGYDHSRPMDARPSYNTSQYLQPPDSEWSTSVHRSDRPPILPSISPGPESRVTGSYTMPPLAAHYGPTVGPVTYQRATWYDGHQSQQHHHRHPSLGHSPLLSGGDPPQRPPHGPHHSHSESDSRPKPRCWDHGCNGREFSTFSNLLRHQRERAGIAQKVACPRCGAEFTRKTARDGHVAHAKCKPVRRSPDPAKGSVGGHGGSQSSHRSSHGHIY